MSENSKETESKTVWTLKNGGKGQPGPGRSKRRKLPATDRHLSPQETVHKLQGEAANLARKIVVQTEALLDRGELKKGEINDLRQLATAFGIFFDKVAKTDYDPPVQIKFPAEVLAALQVGIALQIAPKPQQAQLSAPVESTTVSIPTVDAESVRDLTHDEVKHGTLR